MDEERQSPREATREWMRASIGILAAFRDAIEETIDDLRERGDISPERAREAVRTTMGRAQRAVEETRERLDFVTRREFDDLRREVAELRARVAGAAGEPEPGAGSEDFPVDEA